MIRLVKKEKYIPINETSYTKLMDYHLENGFCIVSAFRSELSTSENRANAREMKSILARMKIGYIPITCGYREMIKKGNKNWDNAQPIEGKPNVRIYASLEESILIPNYNRETDSCYSSFDIIKEVALELGESFNQEVVLVSPPKHIGSAYYVITSDDYALQKGSRISAVDMQFNHMTLANISDKYFTSLTKTINKLKNQGNAGGVKFEAKQYKFGYFNAPRYYMPDAHGAHAMWELPVFYSHYYPMSSLCYDD